MIIDLERNDLAVLCTAQERLFSLGLLNPAKRFSRRRNRRG